MAAFDTLELANELTPEVKTMLHYFCKDTTERILKNIARLKIGEDYSGSLKASIHTTLYVNAGGNDALIRFYYLNYAGYLESGLGAYDHWDNVKKGGGIGAKNADVPAIGGSGFGSLTPDLKGVENYVRKSERKGKHHRADIHQAKPFLQSEIRLHLRGTQKRLAMLLGYTATAYMTRGLLGMFTRDDRKAAETLYNNSQSLQGEVGHSLHRLENQMAQQHFDVLRKNEEAALKLSGYLKHIERDWGLSSFAAEKLL